MCNFVISSGREGGRTKVENARYFVKRLLTLVTCIVQIVFKALRLNMKVTCTPSNQSVRTNITTWAITPTLLDSKSLREVSHIRAFLGI